MNFTRPEARKYLRTLRELVRHRDGRTVFVLTPFTDLAVAEQELAGSQIFYGAQDVHPEEAGAHTGDVSAAMLAELGCRVVEIGHSERRRDHWESDELIGRKARVVIEHGMWPLLCVGESAADRAAGDEETVIARQLDGALRSLGPDLLDRVIVAYEPWWAIGVGATSAPLDHVERLHAFIGSWLARLGPWASPPVLYGGSVDLANAPDLLALPTVDGLFVGRAALDPLTFARIAALDAAHPAPSVGRGAHAGGG